MILTSIIFLAYYNNLEHVQRKDDKNRIKNLKSVVEMEDLDFMQMVSDLKLDYDVSDLREIEGNLTTRADLIQDIQSLQKKWL